MTQHLVYSVKRGDTLWGISRKTGVEINSLARLNNLHGKAVHRLQVGQRIKLPTTSGNHDTELTLQILDIKFAPIKNAHLKLEYDGKTQEIKADADGLVSGILIDDHSKGLKVHFRGIDGTFSLIASHATLPLGRKNLTLTSRTMMVKGNYAIKPGAQWQAKKVIPAQIRTTNKEVHIKPQGPLPKPSQPGGEPKPFVKETRVEGGTPLHAAAAIFTEANLLLSPANEKYRKLIITSAERYGFTPQALTALIDAEADKSKNGWKADSVNKATGAAGLTQFLRGTWLEMVAEPRSLMNQRLQNEHKIGKIAGKRDSDGVYCLYVNGRNGSAKEEKLDDTLVPVVLSWRFIPEYSIDTAALYGKINLEKLTKRGLDIDSLAPEDLAKVMYLAHHEGAGGAAAVMKGKLQTKTAERNLPKQIGQSEAAKLITRFNDKAEEAYTYWLYELLVDKKINVAHFMVKAEGVKPRTMAEIAATLGGPAPSTPAAKTPPRPPELPAQAGAAEAWRDPLDHCELRTAELLSKKGAMFGMTRIDKHTKKPRPHQGIDLVAIPGTPIYAVANAKVVHVNHKAVVNENYGKTITLEVDVKDLPPKQRELVLKQYPEQEMVYFYYAHLTDIYVTESDNLIAMGTELGTTGHTGNAHGMNTIARGAHLHFEVRLAERPGAKLANRMDPVPFINERL